MNSLLRDWDEASKARRKKLLEWFCDRFTHANGSNESDSGELLESECGGADASLFLARVLVWMHKTVTSSAKCFALSEQLACIQVFLTSTNVHTHYREFQQADGLALLVRVLGIENPQSSSIVLVSDADRIVIMELLLRISQRGRAHKEEISRCNGEIAIIRGALAGTQRCGANVDVMAASPLWDACRDALLEQMVGNPKSVERVHDVIVFMLQHEKEKELQVFGAQILRHLITPDSFYLNLAYRRTKERELVPLAMRILQSSDIPLQHEGLELVHSLLQSKHAQPVICKALIDWVKNATLTLEPLEERFAPVQFTREYETFSHMRSPFVHAAQSVSTLMSSSPAILPLMVQQYDVLVPLSFALVVERSQSLKWYAAAIAIHYVFTNYHKVATAHLARIFSLPVEKLLAWKAHKQPEDLAKVLLQGDEQQRLLALQFYQNGWRKPIIAGHLQHIDQQQQQQYDEELLEDVHDSELIRLESEVEVTMRDFVPELQVPSHFDPASDERDLFCDDMDQQREAQMRTALQRHFTQFRLSSSAYVDTPVSPS